MVTMTLWPKVVNLRLTAILLMLAIVEFAAGRGGRGGGGGRGAGGRGRGSRAWSGSATGAARSRGGSRFHSSYISYRPAARYSRLYSDYHGYYRQYYTEYFYHSGTTAYLRRAVPDEGARVCANYEANDDGVMMGVFSCPNSFEPKEFTACCGEDYAEFCCEPPKGLSSSQIFGAVVGVFVACCVAAFCYKYASHKCEPQKEDNKEASGGEASAPSAIEGATEEHPTGKIYLCLADREPDGDQADLSQLPLMEHIGPTGPDLPPPPYEEALRLQPPPDYYSRTPHGKENETPNDNSYRS